MAADTYDSILGLLLMGTGNDNNSWGTNANSYVFSPAAQAIAGVNTISATGGSYALNTTVPPSGLRTDVHAIQLLNGTLTSDLTITVNNISKVWWFENDTTGNYNVFVKVPSGASPNGLIQIPQGRGVWVMCDGNGNLRRHDRDQVGTFVHAGGSSAPAGTLACNGASLLRSEYPDLYNAIGTTWGSVDSLHFTLPLLTDNNRFLRAADGTNITVGQYQSSQNLTHTHTGSGTTGSTSIAHTHTQQGTFTSQTMSANNTHTHGVTGGTYASSSSVGGGVNNGGGFTTLTGNPTLISISNANIDHTHNVIISGQTGGMSANDPHTHSYSFTTSSGSADGSEARPYAAGVLICIRY